MAEFKKTIPRLQEIKRRQYPQRWGVEYQASIRATPKEAPSVSWAGTLTPAKLGGREFHLIGRPAKWFGLLALYHPLVWEIWEERVLHTFPYPHPLHGHERALGIEFAPFKGTLDVAERLGIQHPKIADRSTAGKEKWLAWPYLGDLLLFLLDDRGPYCVNWPIKDTQKAFRRPGPKTRGKPRLDVDHPAAIARNDLETEYHNDAGIRTQRLSQEDIDSEVRNNLYDLFLAHRKPVPISAVERDQATFELASSIRESQPAYRTLQRLERELGLSKESSIALLKQLIWERKVRVDLFRPVLTDQPLHPEGTEILAHYAAWFVR